MPEGGRISGDRAVRHRVLDTPYQTYIIILRSNSAIVRGIPMELSEEDCDNLGVALNEATLLGVEVDLEKRRAAATLAVLTLPPEGPGPKDSRVQIVFERLERVAASLRRGRWDDPTALVDPFGVNELLPKVQSFGGLPIYGWEFFDIADETFPALSNRLSFDVSLGAAGGTHSFVVFQEGIDRHLDLWLWFDHFTIRDSLGVVIPLNEFVAGGRRWWDAFHRLDPRTQGHGIDPLV
jgi:hypothetical protein